MKGSRGGEGRSGDAFEVKRSRLRFNFVRYCWKGFDKMWVIVIVIVIVNVIFL